MDTAFWPTLLLGIITVIVTVALVALVMLSLPRLIHGQGTEMEIVGRLYCTLLGVPFLVTPIGLLLVHYLGLWLGVPTS